MRVRFGIMRQPCLSLRRLLGNGEVVKGLHRIRSAEEAHVSAPKPVATGPSPAAIRKGFELGAPRVACLVRGSRKHVFSAGEGRGFGVAGTLAHPSSLCWLWMWRRPSARIQRCRAGSEFHGGVAWGIPRRDGREPRSKTRGCGLRSVNEGRGLFPGF